MTCTSLTVPPGGDDARHSFSNDLVDTELIYSPPGPDDDADRAGYETASSTDLDRQLVAIDRADGDDIAVVYVLNGCGSGQRRPGRRPGPIRASDHG